MSQQPQMRRDMHMESYKSAAAFRRHAAQMRRAGWQIGPHREERGRATVTWYRDVPVNVPPDANIPPQSHRGLPPLAIVGIVLGGLVVIGIVGAALGSGDTSRATATPRPATATIAASVTAPQTGSSPSGGPVQTVASIPTSTAPAAATPVPTSVPQVVTAKDNTVNVRQSADPDAAIIASLDVGADAPVLGEDTTGPDGATRWVHIRAGDKDGYVRSDLVSAPHVATPVPTPAPTPTPEPDLYADYPIIDAADWVKRPDFYIGKRFSVIGEAFNVHESNGTTTFQMFAETALGKTVAVGVVFNGTSSLVDGNKLRAYGVGKGTFTGTNGFGASITQPVMDAVQIGPPTAATNSATATRDAGNRNATGTALVRDTNRLLATSTALSGETDSVIATSDAVVRSSNATLTALPKRP